MKIAVDFDGVLVDRKGIPTCSYVWSDEPKDGAVRSLWEFVYKNIEFYILTNRPSEDFKKIRKWAENWGFPEDILITNKKQPNTTVYLDDRAVRFTNWNDFRKLYL